MAWLLFSPPPKKKYMLKRVNLVNTCPNMLRLTFVEMASVKIGVCEHKIRMSLIPELVRIAGNVVYFNNKQHAQMSQP